MFDEERPITSNTQDRLGRGVFAKYLARCMLDHKDPESLVIGLYGGWGTGKTSLINLALEELRFASSNMMDPEKPIILNFSPWSYSGQGQLIYGFFRRLSSELRQCPNLENGAEIINLLELYVSFFTHQPVPKPLRLKNRLLAKLKKNPFARDPAPEEKKLNYAWDSGRDPTQVKAQLNTLLKKQKHKIIICIDNISRIEANEINQILQIVKSMGDYANTIYLLSLDKDQVVKAIDQTHNGEGNEYLDKLVQLPFAVPPISKQDVESLLFDRLSPVIQLARENTWSTAYWADIYFSSLKYFFNSCRDITRYVNTLSFSFAFVKDVVNTVDFFALTAIEVFAPRILYGIRENKDLFTDLLDNVYTVNAEQLHKDRLRCDEILARDNNIPKEVLLLLIMHLFPRMRNVYMPHEKFYHSHSLAREQFRICNPDMFDIYFRLSIPTGYMPDSELDMLLLQTNNADNFDQMLTRLNQDGRITRFLDLLDTTAQHKISLENTGNVIEGLFDSADLFPEGETTPLRFNSFMRVHRICHQLLHRVQNSEARLEILQNAIMKANKSIYIIVHELNAQSDQHVENEDSFLPSEHRDLNQSQLNQLRELASEKIAYWARIDRLIEHPKLLPILLAWKDWGHGEDCQQFIDLSVRTDRGLLFFLGAALQIPVEQAVSKQEKNPEWKKYLDNITYFVPTETLQAHAITIFEDDSFEQLREKEQLAILIFLDLIDAPTTKLIPKTTV
jgi:predicted KAP-like P-loop ATPase